MEGFLLKGLLSLVVLSNIIFPSGVQESDIKTSIQVNLPVKPGTIQKNAYTKNRPGSNRRNEILYKRIP